MNAQSILPGMAVFGSCGNRLGFVDCFEDGAIKLRRTGPEADGSHHFIPVEWVNRSDGHVHLNVDCDHAREAWQIEGIPIPG
jgi:hypothetical protein